jgi:ABC-type polysaccharide/polyol phosphate transport system ATPase subunit/ABC-type polysaccharide/polyol phosphate export permease
MTSATAGFDLTGEPERLRTLVGRIWRSRALIMILARKEFYVRYRRASFGLLWAVGLPLIQAIVLAVVFSHVVHIQTGSSYPVFMFCGILPWSFFSLTLASASTAIVDNAAMSSKIYFPRAVLPIVSVMAALYGFVISLPILIIFAVGYGTPLTPRMLLLIPGVLLTTVLAAAFTVLLSALHVYFRDIRYIVQAAMTAWIYLAPIIYPINYAPHSIRWLIKADPVTGVVELFRLAADTCRHRRLGGRADGHRRLPAPPPRPPVRRPVVTDEPAIALRNVGKRFLKYEDAPMLITAALKFRAKTRRSHLWAVRGVDLEVGRGECVGVIGRNGSGKSTLLQMLAGVTAPTEGRVTVRGRVAPLISVGVGFHPELTGRENVYLNGTILGLNRSEIDRKFDDIIEFADIGPFVDTPVKFFSSGMFVRLGFAVAVYADPEILLIDEVLAVGDMAFQMKCFERMTLIRQAGTTIAVVSHNLNAVRMLCDRTLLLHRGDPKFLGASEDAISMFHRLVDDDREPELDESGARAHRAGGVATIDSVELLTAEGAPTGSVQYGDTVVFRVNATFHAEVVDPIVGIVLRSSAGVTVYVDSSFPPALGTFPAGEHIVLDIRVELPLVTGTYSVSAGLHTLDGTTFDESPSQHFYVAGRNRLLHGVADLAASFELHRSATAPEPPFNGTSPDALVPPEDQVL